MVLSLLGLFLLAASSAPPLEITVDPRPAICSVTLAGPAEGNGEGEFRGNLSLNGSSAGLPVSGRARVGGGRARIEATVRYADVPEDWLARLRPDSFDYRVRGEINGAGPVSWSGRMPWSEVVVSGGGEALSSFIELTSLELIELSDKHSEGRAVLAIRNPFAFPVTATAASYRVRVNGQEVGGGGPRERMVKAKHRTGLELPFRVDRGRFLSAAGGSWAVGAAVESGVEGLLKLRVAANAVEVPLKLSGTMGTDGVRSGVFTYPDGATSLSPH
jgi:LEA14-like dessication related protein